MLKMDVEGAEWDVLLKLSDQVLTRFSHIVLEAHGVYRNINNPTRILSYLKRYKVLEKLKKYFHLVHVHANNF